MKTTPAGALLQYLQQVPDPRGRQGRRHPLAAMLAAIVCATLCGIRGYRPIAEWLLAQPPEVWHALGFTRRPPGIDGYRDLLLALDPVALEDALARWVREAVGLDPQAAAMTVAIDGKVLRGTWESHAQSVRLLAAVDHQTGGVLHQMNVPPETNEHKTALKMIRRLVHEGTIFTGDAAFTQRDVCEEILDCGGDYVLPVKENQPDLLRTIETEFAADEAVFSPLRPAEAG